MKIVHPKINSKIEISDHEISVLVIEAPEFFYELLMDIKSQINNFEGNTVLSVRNEPVSFHKCVELITDPLAIEMNSRTIIKKVLVAMEKCGQDAVYYERTQKLLAEIETYINDLSLNFDSEIECHDISFQQILKAAELTVADEYSRLVDKIYAYMELIREFEGDKLFIFVNLSSYIRKEQLQEFVNTVVGHSFRVLLIDSHDFERLEQENRLIVDCDLCEF
ncbi:type II-A CRISPR-associated protein Csn2 [Mediterraneibacter glycyrrhizinilyticus]|uniref:type II-A CRISPR-associated protein Csn2 n=1 Tax=Mediterraneibacter glycyrrhizinilyticus TaxID=342942 RepID=UPI000E407818|nr:type II-A CRISPR-associated protein Csn2 [Mediterraneibacter glycyrrhizinilyticus]MCB6308429.1 type II-A CRISPR-associated protein Csn2 [Lachnospiraceae bacterium 210521-DFI.1.109]MCB6426932.1 type II-A CRISPR-associated protein Csn2 [Mediterraneibacter glycyrrhizinilyticus]RGC74034.1 type II-A CRISPR-associated protein Csn2 [Lachnospiraceae bacterium AM23-2LB]RJW02606.1 type II-A CRISPR-associated protein Csn2 [Lachnospiraceae bacterium AM40-2BH]